MDIHIRPARPGDIPAMTGLLGDLFSIETDFTPDAEYQARGLCSLVADRSQRSCVLVAEKGGDIIGMASVQMLLSTAEGGRVGLVEDVVVHRDHRRQGIGVRLLQGIIDWSRRRGLLRLQLLAAKDNAPALAFYDCAGLRKTGMICLRLYL